MCPCHRADLPSSADGGKCKDLQVSNFEILPFLNSTLNRMPECLDSCYCQLELFGSALIPVICELETIVRFL